MPATFKVAWSQETTRIMLPFGAPPKFGEIAI